MLSNLRSITPNLPAVQKFFKAERLLLFSYFYPNDTLPANASLPVFSINPIRLKNI